jgi:hypothetical protein
MKNIIEDINKIISEWDPLDVGEGIATDEYKRYIPLILKHTKDKEDLTICLEDILMNSLKIDYDKENDEHKNSLKNVVEKIMNIRHVQGF